MAEIKNRATLDSTQFQAGLKGMQGRVQGLASSIKSLPGIGGALSVTALAAAAGSALKAADEIDNLASQMGMGVESVQAYQVALGEAGLSMGSLQSASDRLKQKQAEAIQGNERSRKSFEDLGISMADLESADTTRLLELVGQGLHQAGGDASATSAQFDLMGRKSERLKEVLIAMNKDGIQAQIQSMKELGLVMDEYMIARLDDAELRIARFGTQVKNTFANLISDVLLGSELMGRMVLGQSPLDALLATQAPVADAAKAKEDRRIEEIKQRQVAAAAATKEELAALKEKMRMQDLTNEELKAELNAKLAIARASLESARSDVEKLNALKRIYQLENDIAGIREEAPRIERESREEKERGPELTSLQRMGALNPNMGAGANRELQIQQRTLRAAEGQWRVLQSIERTLKPTTKQGASF